MNNIKLKNFIYKNFGDVCIKLRETRHYEYDGNDSWFEDVCLVVHMNQPDRVQQLLNRKPYISMGVSGYYLSNSAGSAFEGELMSVYRSKTGKVYEDNKEFFDKVGAFIEAENEKIRLNEINKLQEKENKEVEKALEALEHTMITRAEVSELLKDIGCAIFKKRFINVQEWANAEKTRYWIKASHTVKQIKCLTVNGLYSKEDILKAIA